MSLLFSLFTGGSGKIIAYLLLVAAIFAGGFKAGYSFDHTRWMAAQAEQAKQTAAVLLKHQQELDKKLAADQEAAMIADAAREQLLAMNSALKNKLDAAMKKDPVLIKQDCAIAPETQKAINDLIGDKK